MEKNRFKPVRSGKNVRMNYSRKSENLADMPNLIEVQTSSYKWFREVGLKEAFRDFFPRGTRIVESVSSSEWVETLAGENDLMLINKHGSTHNVVITVDGKEIETTLKGFEVKTIRYNE